MSLKFKYATIGLLFVNVSIGGTLTHFAAPPVLMVAAKWNLGIVEMISQFGYKAAIACIISAFVIAFAFKKELAGDFDLRPDNKDKISPAWWITLVHVIFLGVVVISAHHMVVFMGLFLFFLGFVKVTEEFQDEVKLKESLMVGFFLGGLIILGSKQAWWLKPVIGQLGDYVLYFGVTGLTAITDNAALTYLGSLVELTEKAKYMLLAGAVTGGGLTVIANAPNPAGYGILKDSFGPDGISPLGLLKGALFPTLVAVICFLVLPSL
jgi:Na+/H+ antiporter NhaD/arsenite permease-like protein